MAVDMMGLIVSVVSVVGGDAVGAGVDFVGSGDVGVGVGGD